MSGFGLQCELQDREEEGLGFDLGLAHMSSFNSCWRNVGLILWCDILAFLFTFALLFLWERQRGKKMVKVGLSRHTQRVRNRSGKGTGRTYVLMLLYLQGIHPGLCFGNGSPSTLFDDPNLDAGDGTRTHLIWSLGNAEDATWEPVILGNVPLGEEDGYMSLMAMGTEAVHDHRSGIRRPEALTDFPGVAEQDDQVDDDDEMDTDSERCDEEEEEAIEVSQSEAEPIATQDHQVSESLGGPYPVDGGDAEHDWEHFFLFRRHHLQRHCYFRWNTYHNQVCNIANTWEVARSDILQIIHMVVDIDGIPEDAKKAITVISNDDPSHDGRSHVLVDVKWHTLPHYLEGPQIHRRVLRLQEQMTRMSILFAAEVGSYCRNQGDRCLVRLNGFRIPLQDTRLHDIRSGGYIQIDLPPVEDCRDEHSFLQIRSQANFPLQLEQSSIQVTIPLERSSEMRFDTTAANFENRISLLESRGSVCRDGWCYSSFEDLAPPGNPEATYFDIASDGEEVKETEREELSCHPIASDSEEDLIGTTKYNPVDIQVKLPEGMHQLLHLLKRWPVNSLSLDFDSECRLLHIATNQFAISERLSTWSG